MGTFEGRVCSIYTEGISAGFERQVAWVGSGSSDSRALPRPEALELGLYPASLSHCLAWTHQPGLLISSGQSREDLPVRLFLSPAPISLKF